MTTTTLNGLAVERTADGFFVHPEQWNRDMALELAKELGLTLTPKHWQVIDFCRKDFESEGQSPGLRRIAKVSGVSMKEIYELFPKGPGKQAAYVSGLPKPQGCV